MGSTDESESKGMMVWLSRGAARGKPRGWVGREGASVNGKGEEHCCGQGDGSQLQIHKGTLFCEHKVKGKSGDVIVQQIKNISGSEW